LPKPSETDGNLRTPFFEFFFFKKKGTTTVMSARASAVENPRPTQRPKLTNETEGANAAAETADGRQQQQQQQQQGASNEAEETAYRFTVKGESVVARAGATFYDLDTFLKKTLSVGEERLSALEFMSSIDGVGRCCGREMGWFRRSSKYDKRASWKNFFGEFAPSSIRWCEVGTDSKLLIDPVTSFSLDTGALKAGLGAVYWEKSAHAASSAVSAAVSAAAPAPRTDADPDWMGDMFPLLKGYLQEDTSILEMGVGATWDGVPGVALFDKGGNLAEHAFGSSGLLEALGSLEKDLGGKVARSAPCPEETAFPKLLKLMRRRRPESFAQIGQRPTEPYLSLVAGNPRKRLGPKLLWHQQSARSSSLTEKFEDLERGACSI
jgi:hypothetical protein